jgi:hypothetical protein
VIFKRYRRKNQERQNKKQNKKENEMVWYGMGMFSELMKKEFKGRS